MNTSPAAIGLVLISSLIGSFAALFLKLGSQNTRKGLAFFVDWRSCLGVGLYLFSSIFFVLGVRQGELSVLYPMVSLGYVWTMFWSRLFLNEPITREKCSALALILVGIGLIGAGGFASPPSLGERLHDAIHFQEFFD